MALAAAGDYAPLFGGMAIMAVLAVDFIFMSTAVFLILGHYGGMTFGAISKFGAVVRQGRWFRGG